MNNRCELILLPQFELLSAFCRPPVSSSYGLPPQADNGPTAAQRSAGAGVGPPGPLLRPGYPPGGIPLRYVTPPASLSAYAATNGQVYVRHQV
jgi:hypothetical protein